jgi:hypothetical protein
MGPPFGAGRVKRNQKENHGQNDSDPLPAPESVYQESPVRSLLSDTIPMRRERPRLIHLDVQR